MLLIFPIQVRSSKHQGKSRVRWKASVHSGHLNDSLNDCITGYCMWFEEHHYLRDTMEADDPARETYHTLKARLCRALACLDQSAGHVVHLLGQGVCAGGCAGSVCSYRARCEVQMCNGVYSFGCIPENRVGIPREFIKGLSKALECPASCTHKEEEEGCNKWAWTVVHKGDYQLEMWQDGNLILGISIKT